MLAKTFEQMCEIEPRLAALCDSIADRFTEETNFWHEWSEIKAEMIRLVGFGSERVELGSCADYDTAYSVLYRTAELTEQEAKCRVSE